MPKRLSSQSKHYNAGNLSVFPKAIDSKASLFEASNNAETTVKHHFTSTSKYLIVDDATTFPSSGLLRLMPKDEADIINGEIIFYQKKIGNQFHMLQRGYGISSVGSWPKGSKVVCPVMAEHQNALIDAIMKIQNKIGLLKNPGTDSLHAQLHKLEQRWLAPKALFRAFPRTGAPSLEVRFQNFSSGHNARYLWDFGDGSTSTEKHPTHIYQKEGVFPVRLNVISSTGAQGQTEKNGYITVTNNERVPFFYCRPLNGFVDETVFQIVDQTDGNIIERHWFFGDGEDVKIMNPNYHVIEHTYKKPGLYKPTLLVYYANGQTSKATFVEGVTVDSK
jgi:PKD repeat protein